MGTQAVQWLFSGVAILLAMSSARNIRDASSDVMSCNRSEDGTVNVKITKSLFKSAYSVCINKHEKFIDEGDGYLHLRIPPGNMMLDNCVFQTKDHTSTYALIVASRLDQWTAEFKCYFSSPNVRVRRIAESDGDQSSKQPRMYVTGSTGNVLSHVNPNSKKAIRMVLDGSGIQGAVGIRPTSCIAYGNTKHDARTILRDGCGLGNVISRTEGFVTDGLISRSSTFKPFAIDNDRILRFECNITICTVNCDGNTCEANTHRGQLPDQSEDSDEVLKGDNSPYMSTNFDVSSRTDMSIINTTSSGSSVGIVQKVTNVQSSHKTPDERSKSLENDHVLQSSPVEQTSHQAQAITNDNNQKSRQTRPRMLDAQTALKQQRILNEQNPNPGIVTRIVPKVISPEEHDYPQNEGEVQNSPKEAVKTEIHSEDNRANRAETNKQVDPSDLVQPQEARDGKSTEQNNAPNYPPDTFGEVKFMDFSDDIGILKLRQPAEGPQLVDTYSEGRDETALPAEDEDMQNTPTQPNPQSQVITDEALESVRENDPEADLETPMTQQSSSSNSKRTQGLVLETEVYPQGSIKTLDNSDLNGNTETHETANSQLNQQAQGSVDDKAFAPSESTRPRSSPTDEVRGRSPPYRNYLPSNDDHMSNPDASLQVPKMNGMMTRQRQLAETELDIESGTNVGKEDRIVKPNLHTERKGTQLLSSSVTKNLLDNSDEFENGIETNELERETTDSTVATDPDVQEVMESTVYSPDADSDEHASGIETDSTNPDEIEVVSDNIYQIAGDKGDTSETSASIVEADVYAKIIDDKSEGENHGYRPTVGSDVINSLNDMKKESESALLNAAVSTDILENPLEQPNVAPVEDTPVVSIETDSFSTEDESQTKVKDHSIHKPPPDIPAENITLNDSQQQPFETVLITETKTNTNSSSDETYVLGSTPAKFAVGAVVVILFALSFLGILVAHCRRRNTQM